MFSVKYNEKNIEGYRNAFGFFYKSDIMKDFYTGVHKDEVPAGGISSTLEDMGKYLRWMMNTSEDDQILPYTQKKDLFSKQIESESGKYYGYGWETSEREGKDKTINGIHSHSGVIFSYNSLTSIYPPII